MNAKKSPQCRACGAPVIWAQSVNGANVQLDKERDLSGTSRHALRHDADGRWYVRVLRQGDSRDTRTEHLHQPHYATCPERTKDKATDA